MTPKIYAIKFSKGEFYGSHSLYAPHASLAKFFSSEKSAEIQRKQYAEEALDTLNFMKDASSRVDDITAEDVEYYQLEYDTWNNAKIVCYELKEFDGS